MKFRCHYNESMAKKRGGQPKPANEQKSANVQIRLLETEKAAFEQAADLSGLATAAWIRMRLREAAATDLGRTGSSRSSCQRLQAERRGIEPSGLSPVPTAGYKAAAPPRRGPLSMGGSGQ